MDLAFLSRCNWSRQDTLTAKPRPCQAGTMFFCALHSELSQFRPFFRRCDTSDRRSRLRYHMKIARRSTPCLANIVRIPTSFTWAAGRWIMTAPSTRRSITPRPSCFPTLDALEAGAESLSADPHRVDLWPARHADQFFVLSDAVAALEGGAGCVITPSGLFCCRRLRCSRCSRRGDHLLMVDTGLWPDPGPSANGILKRMGIETTYYDSADRGRHLPG